MREWDSRKRSFCPIVCVRSDGEQDHSVLPWWCIGQTSYWLALPFCLDTSCHLCLESGIQDASASFESLQNKSPLALVVSSGASVLWWIRSSAWSQGLTVERHLHQTKPDRTSIIAKSCWWARSPTERRLLTSTRRQAALSVSVISSATQIVPQWLPVIIWGSSLQGPNCCLDMSVALYFS